MHLVCRCARSRPVDVVFRWINKGTRSPQAGCPSGSGDYAIVSWTPRSRNEIESGYTRGRGISRMNTSTKWTGQVSGLVSCSAYTNSEAYTPMGLERFGPFAVVCQISPYAYELDIPQSRRIHWVQPVSLLDPEANDPLVEHRLEPPLSVEDDGEQEYQVSSVEDSRVYWNQLQYLIRWT